MLKLSFKQGFMGDRGFDDSNSYFVAGLGCVIFLRWK
jgi:hypothetical protein